MNTDIKYSTLENVEIGEVFVINLKGKLYLGWRKEDCFYQCVNNTGGTGSFNLDQLEMDEYVVILGNTSTINDVVRVAPWALGRSGKSGIPSHPAGLDALQSLAALRMAVETAESLKNLITTEL